jgi:L-threonylcarbamoyladenylate synthase
LIKAGGVAAFPTETVYGLGADAWNLSAVQKVFETKGRPPDNPLIVHICSQEMLKAFAAEVPKEAELLIDTFWPGPLTFIFKKKPKVLDAITAGLDTVAIRWPSHPLAQELIAQSGPLVAPSANSSGRPSPTKPEHVKEDFGEGFPVIEAGETQIGLESTVLDISARPFCIYRPGAVSAKQIEDTINQPVEMGGPSTEGGASRSPGTKYSHYAPQAVVKWLDDEEITESETTLYLLHTLTPEKKIGNSITFEGNYDKMAHQLFDRFRQADHQGYREIRIEPFTDDQLQQIPIAAALQNRISKAVE